MRLMLYEFFIETFVWLSFRFLEHQMASRSVQSIGGDTVEHRAGVKYTFSPKLQIQMHIFNQIQIQIRSYFHIIQIRFQRGIKYKYVFDPRPRLEHIGTGLNLVVCYLYNNAIASCVSVSPGLQARSSSSELISNNEWYAALSTASGNLKSEWVSNVQSGMCQYAGNCCKEPK